MLVYHGNNPRLSEALDVHRHGLGQAYKHVLGEDLYARLEDAERRLVTPLSFSAHNSGIMEMSSESSGIAGFGLYHKWNFGERESVKLLGLDGYVIDDDIEMRTAPIFRFPDGFNKRNIRNIPDYVSSFGHEWNHFLFYAIQEYPLQALVYMPIQLLNANGYRTNLCDTMEQARPEHRQLAAMAWNLMVLCELFTIKMGDMVWQKLGYTTDDILGDLGKKMLSHANLAHGDVSDSDFIRMAVDWENNFVVRDCERFMESFPEKVRIRKFALDELQDQN